MSSKLASLVLDHGPRCASAKLILMCLADRADASGVCFPSRRDLMERTGLGATALTVHLRSLEADKWLQRKQRFNSSTVFRVNVSRLLALAADRERQRKIPAGFVPFPEETSQPIENKGDDAKRHTDDVKRHTDDASRHLNLPINLSINKVLSDVEFKRFLATSRPGESRVAWAARNAKVAGAGVHAHRGSVDAAQNGVAYHVR
jgi:hypothetical protein